MLSFSLSAPNKEIADSLCRNFNDISASALYRDQQRSSEDEGQPQQSIKHKAAPSNGGNLPAQNIVNDLRIVDLGNHFPFGQHLQIDPRNPATNSACHSGWPRLRVIKQNLSRTVPKMHSEQHDC